MNKYIIPVVLAVAATAFSYAVAVLFGWTTIDNIGLVEIGAVLFSYISAIQCIFQTRWNYVSGILGTLFYSILFYQMDLYALATFNLYLVFSQIYGYYRWRDDTNTKPVTMVKDSWWLGYAGLFVAIGGGFMLVNNIFGTTISTTEIFITAMSGVAQFLLDNKKLESWTFWIVVNVVSLFFYANSELYLVALQYIFFLGNAIIGLIAWYESYYDDYANEEIF